MHLYILSLVSVLLLLCIPFIMTEVVSFEKCSEHFFNNQEPGILDASCSQGEENYKKICQKYKNKYRFATLYDTTHRIPVFSAYRYTGTGALNLQEIPPMMVEPQLDPSNDEMGVEYENQVTRGDFYGRSPLYLISSSYAADREIAESTFTLTNSVLLNPTSHEVWNNMVNEHKQFMDNDCRDKRKTKVLAYVLAGALPDRTNTDEKSKLKIKVKSPSHMWTAFCCYSTTAKTWVSKAQWAINEENNLRITTGELKDLKEFLKEKFNAEIQLFDNDCKEPQQSGRRLSLLNCCNCFRGSRNND